MRDVLLRYRRAFDAAHQLPFHEGKCRRLHGHRWTVEVALRGQVKTGSGPNSGMVMDFADLKRELDEILPDHLSMNEATAAKEHLLTVPDPVSRWEFAVENPTCEIIAMVLHRELVERLYGVDPMVEVVSVRVWETPNGDATYPA